MRSIITILLIAILWASPARSATYYVDASLGAEDNNGQQGSPFLRIQQCADVAAPGDNCLIKTGTYRETVRPVTSGSPGNPITFRPATAQDEVIVSGLDIVNGPWSVHQGSIYKTESMNWDVYTFNTSMTVANQIFVNQVMMPEARWPNIKPQDVTALSFGMMAQMDSVSLTTNNTGTFYCSALQDSFWDGGVIVLAPGYAWGTGSCDISGSRSGSIDVNCVRKNGVGPVSWIVGASGTDPVTPQAGNYFWLFGKLQALDVPGEWFFDRATKTLYLWLEDSTSPSTKIIEAKARIHGFNLFQRSYITVEGISVIGATIYAENSQNIILKNVAVLYGSHSMEIGATYRYVARQAAITFFNTNDSQLIDSTIKHHSGMGYYVSGVRNLAKNNAFSYLGYGPNGDGIRGEIPKQSNVTIDVGSDHNEFVQNTLHTCGGVMIALGSGHNIRYNDVWNSGIQRADLGLIYGYQCNGYTADIDHNWSHDCVSPWNLTLNYFGCSGIYLDEECSNYRTYRNVAWGVTSSPFSTVGGDGAYNNLYAYNTGIGKGFFVSGGLYVNNKITNNILDDIDERDGVEITNNFSLDPLFVDEISHDYRLRPYSPAIGGAVRIGAPFDDLIANNKVPDFGAYDTNLPSWIPGAQVRESDLTSLTMACTSTSSGNLDCQIGGFPEGRKLTSGLQINVGPAGSSSPTGTASTCTTKFDYKTNQGVGVCDGIQPASGTTSGTSLSIFIKFNNTGSWIATNLTTTLNSLAISRVEPNGGLAGTVITISGSAFPFNIGTTNAMKYSAQVTVNGPGNNDLFKYPVLLTLDTASLIVSSKLQSDCFDIAFTDSYGSLPYWIEPESCNTTTTFIWVRVSYIARTGSTTFTMQYGNPGVTKSLSSPSNTFIFFEDFNGPTPNGVLSSGSYYSTVVQDGQLRLTGSSNTSNRYTWISFFDIGPDNDNVIRQGSFAIDSEVAVVNAPAGWALSPSGASTALVGALVNNKKPISQQASGWKKIGESSVIGATFSTMKKYSVGFVGTAATNYDIQWFEDYNFTASIAQVSDVTGVNFGNFWFGPQDTFTNFDVRIDNVRARPFNSPEPTITIGTETSSVSYLEVTVGGRSCLNVQVLSSGSIQCTVDTLSIALGTWVDVKVETDKGSAILPSSFYYGDTSSPAFDPNNNNPSNTPGSQQYNSSSNVINLPRLILAFFISLAL